MLKLPITYEYPKAVALFACAGRLGLTFAAGYSAYPLLHGALAEPFVVDTAARPAVDGVLGGPGGCLIAISTVTNRYDRAYLGRRYPRHGRVLGDPYTYFVEPRARDLERDELRGKFGGIGANLEQTDAGYVLHPVPEQPAERAGIRDGDILLLVDDQEITPQMSVDDLVAGAGLLAAR